MTSNRTLYRINLYRNENPQRKFSAGDFICAYENQMCCKYRYLFVVS